jgi:hypothetical protein
VSVEAETTRVETFNAPDMLIVAEPVPIAVNDDPVTPDARVDPVKPLAGTAAAVMLVLQVTALDPPLVAHCSALAAVEQDGIPTAVGDAVEPVAFTRTVLAACVAKMESGIVPAPETVPVNVGLASVVAVNVCVAPSVAMVSELELLGM